MINDATNLLFLARNRGPLDVHRGTLWIAIYRFYASTGEDLFHLHLQILLV